MMANLNNFVVENGTSYDLEDMFKTVRGLLQNDLPDEELKTFMRSESFLQICPEIHEAFNSREREELQRKNFKSGLTGGIQSQRQEKKCDIPETSGKIRRESATDIPPPKIKIKDDPDHTKRKQEPIEGPSGVKKQRIRVFSISSSDESDSDHRKHHAKKVKKKKKHKKSSHKQSSRSSSADSSLPEQKHVVQKKAEVKVDSEKPKTEGNAPKVHPFYLGKMGPVTQPKGKLFGNQDDDDSDLERRRIRRLEKERREAHRRKHQPPPVREPKPYSHYNGFASKVGNGKNWKAREENEFSRFQKKHKLKPVSVVCIDLIKLDTIFHSPKELPRPGTIPLKRRMNISDNKTNEIDSQEKSKTDPFKPILNKIHIRNLKNRRASRDSSDDSRDIREKNRFRRALDSSSDSSDPMIPQKRARQDSGDRRHDSHRKNTAEWRKEQRKKGLEHLRAKTEQKNQGTRKLPWEDKGYYDKKKDSAREKKDDKGNTKDKNKVENRLAKIPKKNAPAVSFQSILQQITAANVEAAQKPIVELKIPKISERPYEYKKPPEKKNIPLSSLAVEVTKLLQSNSKVEAPQMPTNTIDFAEYTIRKIGWWFLKSEKEPPDEVKFHPELHDHETTEDWYNPSEFEWDDDTSSVGCVSDPEGTSKEKAEPNLDPDVLDEFCGLTSLGSKIRRHGETRAKDYMTSFMKVRPGFNYEKTNFEAKCFLCEEKILGQRNLGAHIRSECHNNHFRNQSLKLANYEESCVSVPFTKVFKAKLVEYSVEEPTPVTLVPSANEMGKVTTAQPAIEIVEIDSPNSPMAIIDSDHFSPEIVQVKDIPVDELSLPSIGLYDLETDDDQLRAKICLRTAGKWTGEMEMKWVKMKEMETQMTAEYNDARERYIGAPDTHPKKEIEWVIFWDRRSCEVEAEGKDPDAHDYGSEWVPFWFKRVQEIMKADIESSLLKMKQNCGLDFETLKGLIDRYGLSDKYNENESKKLEKKDLSPQNDIQNADSQNPPQLSQMNLSQRPFTEPLKVLQQQGEQRQSGPKQPPTAPPPPMLARLNKHNPIGNQNNRRRYGDYKRESRDRGGRRDNDTRKENPNPNPYVWRASNYDKDKNRNVEHRRDDSKRESKHGPPPKESRDMNNKAKPVIQEFRQNKDTRSPKSNKSPVSDWEAESWEVEAEPKLSKKVTESRPQTAVKDFSLDMLDVNPIEYTITPTYAPVRDEPSKLEKQLEEPQNKPKNLKACLAELKEAMEVVEPFVAKLPDSLDAINKVEPVTDHPLQCSPIVSGAGFEDNSPISAAGSTSPVNTSVVMEDDVDVVEKEKCTVKAKTPHGPSSPEDGEIGSGASSVSMCVDRNRISSFIKTPGPDAAALANLDKNSLGYQLIVRNLQGEVNVDSDSPKRHSSPNEYKNQLDALEAQNPIGHKEKRKKNKHEKLSQEESPRSNDLPNRSQERYDSKHNKPLKPPHSHWNNSRGSAAGPKNSKSKWNKGFEQVSHLTPTSPFNSRKDKPLHWDNSRGSAPGPKSSKPGWNKMYEPPSYATPSPPWKNKSSHWDNSRGSAPGPKSSKPGWKTFEQVSYPIPTIPATAPPPPPPTCSYEYMEESWEDNLDAIPLPQPEAYLPQRSMPSPPPPPKFSSW